MAKIISIIVAVSEDNGIGNNNKLLTYISADLKHFKEITKGHTIVMGRNTWLSLPKKPLPFRTNIVITSDSDAVFEGAITANSIDDAIAKCPDNEESFIIGGAKIYEQFMPIADKIYLTKIHKKFPSDTFFPEIKNQQWRETKREDIYNDEQANTDYSFIYFERSSL